MKNEIKYKGYTIVRWVVCISSITEEILAEFDDMRLAKKEYGSCYNVDLKYAAAETINDYGDCNPAVYGDTLSEATNKLKKLL